MALSSTSDPTRNLDRLTAEIRRCRICRDRPDGTPLPHEPRPVVRPSLTARIVVCGQAPGTRVHASGIPFTDPSGVRLRAWMGVSEAEFYDHTRIAIVPMGFCFPGQDARGADLKPRRECAATWHRRLFDAMPQLDLFLLVGGYAQAWHLGGQVRSSLTETVADWRAYTRRDRDAQVLPLPHPSWRNNGWLRTNPWFEKDLLPHLRREVRQRL